MDVGKRAMNTAGLLEILFNDLTKAILDASQLMLASIHGINEIFYKSIVFSGDAGHNPELYILMDFIEIWQSDGLIKKNADKNNGTKNLFDQTNILFWQMLLSLRKKGEGFICKLNQEDIPLIESIANVFSMSSGLRPEEIICRLSLIRPEEAWKSIFLMRVCGILKPYALNFGDKGVVKTKIHLTYMLNKSNLQVQIRKTKKRQISTEKVVDINLARKVRDQRFSLF